MPTNSLTTTHNLIPKPAQGDQARIWELNGESMDHIDGILNRVIGAKVASSFSQNLPNSTDTVLTWEFESWDSGGCHDNVTNNSRITVPTGEGGAWAVCGVIAFGANSTGSRRVAVLLNGSVLSYFSAPALAAETTRVPFALTASASAGGYFEVAARQSSGGALVTVGALIETHFSAYRIGRIA